jgi:signal transduction histidine kinase
MQRLSDRQRFRTRPDWADGRLIIAGLQRKGDPEWTVARVPVPGREPGSFSGIIGQTLILYVVLVGGLAFMLRRITRPLADLTRRVAHFANTREIAGQLEPAGPEDTRRLIEAHNAMEARISALLDEKDVMLGAIGHDLKTPLAALRVRIESVEDDTERARMAASIEDITRTLDDILSLARVGRPSDTPENTELSALVASVVEEFEDMGENVELGETARIALPVRATWLRRALRNLVANALRYGGVARVSLVRENDVLAIRVDDDGPGIPDGEIAAMLEPFRRGDPSRSKGTGGAGLGLTLARAIAEQHGGCLKLVNRRGADGAVEGLRAEIRLRAA